MIEGIDPQELREVYLSEFNELLTLYASACKIITHEKRVHKLRNAYDDIFRVFHTIKGTSSYFEGYEPLIEFAKTATEYFRELPEASFGHEGLRKWSKHGLSQLSVAKSAIEKGMSLEAFTFYPPPFASNELF